MELTFHWQKIYIHYSSINTLPLHASIQLLSHSLNVTILGVCVRFDLRVCVCGEKCMSGAQPTVCDGCKHAHAHAHTRTHTVYKHK